MSQDHDPRTASGPDEAFERLRAADPAAHLTPDAASLDAAVRSRVGDGVTASADAPATTPAAPGAVTDRDELAAARARRRPGRWLTVAAVAASTVAVGSVGYALGDRTGDEVAAVSTATGSLPAASTGEAAGRSAGGVAGAPAPGVGTEAAAADSAASVPSFDGRITFTARGLSDATGSAEAWTYDPTAAFGADTAARVAGALGLGGEPRLEGGAWVVGPTDGTGPSLQVQPDGVTSIWFYDPTRDPFACSSPLPEIATDGGGGSDASSLVAPDVPRCTTTGDATGEAPQGDAAVADARELLDAVGADPDAFEYEVTDSGTPEASFVVAQASLGGQRTGLSWSVTLVGDGVQALYGYLAPVVPLGTYDVVSANEAVARLSDPRFGSFAGPMPAAAAQDAGAVREPAAAPDVAVSGDGAPGGGTVPPAPLVAGSSFAWPVTEVVLTGARLSLVQHTQPDGTTVLLPAYELTGTDGTAWSVVAVAESGLDFTAGS